MRCPNCGQRLADEARKCPVCGTVIDEIVRINIPEKQAEETKISYAGEDVSGQSSETEEHHSFETENIKAKQCFPAMPMKWYKFLIYFSLILTGLSNMYTGVQAVMGMQYGTKEQSAQVYAVYPGLHSAADYFRCFCIYCPTAAGGIQGKGTEVSADYVHCITCA